MSQVTLESVDIIEIQTFVIGLPVGPAALPSPPSRAWLLVASLPAPLLPWHLPGFFFDYTGGFYFYFYFILPLPPPLLSPSLALPQTMAATV